MKPPSESRVFSTLTIIFLLGILFSVWSVSYADDDCRGNCDGVNTTVKTILNAGDNTVDSSNHVSGSRSLALSNGMGDVDIAGCLGSTQWGTPLFSKQKLVLNQVCMAEFYLNNGLYDLAAMSLCNVPEIVKEFGSEAECEDAHNFAPVLHVEPLPMVEPIEDTDEHESLIARLSALEADRMAEAEKAEKAAQRANAAAQRAKEADLERKEYAQQIYEELQQWK